MHANNSHHALGRILSFYSPEARPARTGPAAGLRAIVSQRLLRSTQGGRMPAVEVLLNTSGLRDDRPGQPLRRQDAMERLMAEGSQTFERTSPG